jgi:hypothetical protein
LREADLVIEQQPVLAAACQDVQTEAHFPQEGLRCFQATQLRHRQKSAGGEPIEGV